jgi:DNA-binding PadR family transcriptional regulator
LKFDWKRLVALTEDGMKYTQYISDMEQNLKDKGINLMINKKFSRVNDKERQLENFKTVSHRKMSAFAS